MQQQYYPLAFCGALPRAGAQLERVPSGLTPAACRLPCRFYHLGPVATPEGWGSSRTTLYSALREPLPPNLHLLALKTDVGQRWGSAIVRLQHIYEAAAANEMAQPATVDPAALFAGDYTVSEELELSGVVPASSVPRMAWTPSETVTPPWVIPAARHTRAGKAPVTLVPMELKVYRLTFV